MPDYPSKESSDTYAKRMARLAEAQRAEALAVVGNDRLRLREVAALERIASALERLAEAHGAAP